MSERRHTYEYSRPALSVDVVVLSVLEGAESVLLVRRGREPFRGEWALPGGFVDELEPLEDAARRELAEETGLVAREPFRQVGAFGDPGRDPRGWTVSVAFVVRLAGEPPALVSGDDADAAEWHRVSHLPRLAFDHTSMVAAALAATVCS